MAGANMHTAKASQTAGLSSATAVPAVSLSSLKESLSALGLPDTPLLRTLLSALSRFGLKAAPAREPFSSFAPRSPQALLRTAAARASSEGPKSSFLAPLLVLALQSKALAPTTGHTAPGTSRLGETTLAKRQRSSRHREIDPAVLLDELDGFIRSFLSLSPVYDSEREGEPAKDDEKDETAEARQEAETLSWPAALSLFNRRPLSNGARWLILPLVSADTHGETRALFRLLLDRERAGEPGDLLSMAAEIRRGELVWRLRLPQSLLRGAPLIVACSSPDALSGQAGRTLVESLAKDLALVLSTATDDDDLFLNEWGEGFERVSAMAERV